MTRRFLLMLTTTALFLGALVTFAAPASAARYPLNPTRNIAPPASTQDAVCFEQAMGRDCMNRWIAALNRARVQLNQPRYVLPGAFRTLAPRDQLLVLSNLDRQLYRRTPIRGLNPILNANAAHGVRVDDDPQFKYVINHHQLTAGGSNWFGAGGGQASPLEAYYYWMYDDGYGSNNIACTSPGASGCWGHRDDTLFSTPAHSQVEMGVGAGHDRNGSVGWTELYESFDATGTIPCIPTVIGMSKHAVRTVGTTVVLYGYGYVHVTKVTALGRRVVITARHTNSLTIRVPAHRAERGYIAVYTPSGRSLLNAAAAFRYV